MLSTLVTLSNLIASSIAELEKACAESKLPFPNLDEPFTPQSEAFRKHPAASEAANVIAAAANQLLSTVLPPPMALGSILSGHFKSAAVRVCLEANVTEILREGGPKGVHAKDIAAKANISGEKIARLLRYLANHHVYREVQPDVFVNNRISSLLDTGKSVSDILADPASKHDNTPGYAALVGHHVDEVAKSSACLWETMSNPETGLSPETTKAPFNRAFDWPGSFWTWLGQPEQANRQRRFGVAMKGVSSLEPVDSILKAFDWKSLPKSSLVVDVGGGIGASSMVLAKNIPDIKIVVQDLPSVAEAGATFWKSELPEAIESGRVVIQAHDFFEPQPVKNASIFLMKQIMHDWVDPYAIKILTRLREVAKPDTQLIIIDSVIPFACHDPSADHGYAVPGAVIKEAPEPLLPNYGVANLTCYTADMTMLCLFNSQERTIKHFTELLQGTGWRLTKVIRNMSDGFLQPIYAVPSSFHKL